MKSFKNKRKPFSRKKAFTLMEILIVIFILILAIGITLISFKDSKPLDEVSVAARGISSLLREAQNNSLTGAIQIESVSGKKVSSCWNGIKWNSGVSGKIELSSYFKEKRPGDTDPCANGVEQDYRVTTYNNVTFDASPVASYVEYMGLTGAIKEIGGAFIESTELNVKAKLRIKSTTNEDVRAMVCLYDNGGIKEVIGVSASQTCPSSI